MNARQQQLFDRARDFSLLAADIYTTKRETDFTPELARDASRHLAKAHAAATALECSLRGDDPKVGG